jgi:hypothetical protein
LQQNSCETRSVTTTVLANAGLPQAVLITTTEDAIIAAVGRKPCISSHNIAGDF